MRPTRVEIRLLRNRIEKLQAQIKKREIEIEECRKYLEKLGDRYFYW